MGDRWMERELLRREKLRRKYLSGLTRRERIEEDLEQEWYTVREAAEELGEHRKTTYRRIRNGEIKADTRRPRKTRIHHTDLAAYMTKESGRKSG
jgi:excisionase family DNA binding protein